MVKKTQFDLLLYYFGRSKISVLQTVTAIESTLSSSVNIFITASFCGPKNFGLWKVGGTYLLKAPKMLRSQKSF